MDDPRAGEAGLRPAHRRGSPFAGVFDVVPVGAVRRRPSDVTRLGVWSLVLAAVSLTADDVRPWGTTLADLVDAIPDVGQATLSELYRWGTLAVVVVAGATAVVRRRWRFALALAATVAVIVAVGLWLADGVDVANRSGGGSPYPAVRLSFAVGVVVVAAPHVTRPLRRLLLAVVAVACVGALTSGDALIVDVLGGVALGSAVAALVHLVVGSPAGAPSLDQIRQSLAARGVVTSRLRPVDDQVWGETRVAATTPDGTELVVSVIGRDATDARLLAKAWRTLWYRDAGGQLAPTRATQVEHQAFVLLWAAAQGVPVPRLVTAGVGGPRADALLVVAQPTGRSLAELSRAVPRPGPAGLEHSERPDGSAPAEGRAGVAAGAPGGEVVTEATLDHTWEALRALHDTGMAHGRIEPAAVVVAADGTVTLADVDRASVDAPRARQELDSVALLVATAEVVGDDRALAAARRALGDEGLTDLLSMVSVAALPPTDSRRRGALKARCTALRQAGATALGVEVPDPQELRRVRPMDILLAVGTIVGVYLLIGQLADLGAVWDTFTSATLGWVVLAAIVTQLPMVANAVALIGSVSQQELPLRQTVAVQVAYKFTGLVGGTVANLALFTRFLQKRGLGVATAGSSAALTSVAQAVAQALLFAIALLFARADFDNPIGGQEGEGGGGLDLGTVLVAIVVLGVIIGVAVGVPQVRRLVTRVLAPQWATAKENLRGVLATPRRAALLLGGYLAAQLLFALSLSLALRAYGHHLPLLDFVVINTVASLLGGLAPVPGGLGVIEAGLVAGLTAAGVPNDAAVAATFTYRTFTAYLSPIWGWASLAWLRRSDAV